MKTRLLMLLIIPCIALLVACGDDDEKTTKFASQAEADAAVEANSDVIEGAYEGAIEAINEAVNFDGTMNFGGFKKSKMKMGKIAGGGYNAGTGWWTWDTTFTEQGMNMSYIYQMRFTPRDGNGFPNNTTDKAEYKASLSENGDDADMSLNANMVIAGLVGYQNQTGNATVNGSFNVTASSTEQQYTFEFLYKWAYKSLVISPAATYPVQSGSIEFTIKYDLRPRVQGFEGYYIAIKITFNGTRYASMTFGGYNYTIDLETGTITPAS